MTKTIDIHFTSFESRTPFRLTLVRVAAGIDDRQTIVTMLREAISKWAVDTVEGRTAWEDDGEWLSFDTILRRYAETDALKKILSEAGLTIVAIEQLHSEMVFDVESSTMIPEASAKLTEMFHKCEVAPWT